MRLGRTGPDQAWLRIWGGELRTGSAVPAPTSTPAKHEVAQLGRGSEPVSGLDGVEKWVRPPEGGPWAGASSLAERPSTDIRGASTLEEPAP